MRFAFFPAAKRLFNESFYGFAYASSSSSLADYIFLNRTATNPALRTCLVDLANVRHLVDMARHGI
jgi:hypothetical protein